MPALAGAIVAGAGIYQFTRLKAHCQTACCRPLALVARHGRGQAIVAAFRTGVANGVHCLGCFWAAMLVLVVVGLMNVVWMVALSLLVSLEKHLLGLRSVSRAAGVALVAVGFAVVVVPDLLPTISGVSDDAPSMTDMSDVSGMSGM